MDISAIIAAWVPVVARVVVLMIVMPLIAKVVLRFAERAPSAMRRQVVYIAPKIVWFFGALILMGAFGIDVTSLLAIMTTLGIGAALVFTPVGQNLIAGFLAGIDDVVRNGDVVEVSGRIGKVVRKGSLSVGVEMPDGSMIYMPNTKAIDDELTNHSRCGSVRIDVEIKLDGSPDRKRAVEVMKQTLEALPWRIQDKPTAVRFTEIGANAMHYRCYVWIEHRLDAPERCSDMLTALVDALEDAQVSVGETGNLSTSQFLVELKKGAPEPLIACHDVAP